MTHHVYVTPKQIAKMERNLRKEIAESQKQGASLARSGLIQAIAVAVIGAVAVVGPPVLQYFKPDPISCSQTYQRVEQLHEKGAVPLFPADSPEQQQCNINSYVKSLGK